MGLTLPTGIDQDDLLLAALEAVMVGDRAVFAVGVGTVAGNYLGDEMLFDNSQYLGYYLFNEYSIWALLGELAEKPGKVDSKVTRLKTRNYQIPGKRSSSIELQLCGLSAAQKDYFESALFSGQEITILLVTNQLASTDPEDTAAYDFSTPVVVFNGLRWTVDWSGEADGLWSIVLSSEITGATKDRVWAQTVPALEAGRGDTPPWEEGEEE